MEYSKMSNWQAKANVDKARSVKKYKKVIEAFHKTNRSGQVPITGYMAPYCGFMLSICKHNMRMAMAKRKMQKEGLPIDERQLVEMG